MFGQSVYRFGPLGSIKERRFLDFWYSPENVARIRNWGATENFQYDLRFARKESSADRVSRVALRARWLRSGRMPAARRHAFWTLT
jgi:hypothetical protein